MRESERESQKQKSKSFQLLKKSCLSDIVSLFRFVFASKKNTTELISMEHKSSNNGEFRIQVSSVNPLLSLLSFKSTVGARMQHAVVCLINVLLFRLPLLLLVLTLIDQKYICVPFAALSLYTALSLLV